MANVSEELVGYRIVSHNEYVELGDQWYHPVDGWSEFEGYFDSTVTRTSQTVMQLIAMFNWPLNILIRRPVYEDSEQEHAPQTWKCTGPQCQTRENDKGHACYWCGAVEKETSSQ